MSDGDAKARDMMIGLVVLAARNFRDASQSAFTDDEPEAFEAWASLDEALTALDDFCDRRARAALKGGGA